MKFEKETLKEIGRITFTKYDENGVVEADEIEEMIKDIIYYYHNLEEQYEDLKQDIEDNYRRIPVEEQYDIYDHQFI